MSAAEDGGPAFPYEERSSDGTPLRDYFGMTLRDYFAAKAMQELLSQNLGGAIRDETLADFAYAMADAMLKARGA